MQTFQQQPLSHRDLIIKIAAEPDPRSDCSRELNLRKYLLDSLAHQMQATIHIETLLTIANDQNLCRKLTAVNQTGIKKDVEREYPLILKSVLIATALILATYPEAMSPQIAAVETAGLQHLSALLKAREVRDEMLGPIRAALRALQEARKMSESGKRRFEALTSETEQC